MVRSWFVFAIPVIAAPLFLLVGAVGLFFRHWRWCSAALVLCSVVYYCSFWTAVQLGRDVRREAFCALAERSKPLVAAIHAYVRKHGGPPQSLEALVPDFLPSVPSTGMGAYPKYDYICPAKAYQGNPWIIRVFTPSGFINFDQFLYFPLTNYPAQGYGGWVERIGEWAYVHE